MMFFPLKKTTRIYFSLHQLVRKEKQNMYNHHGVSQRECHLFSHDELLCHSELHTLFVFLHEQKLFRHVVLQLHLLYPWPPNSDAFSAHSLNETIDGTSEMLTVPSVHVVNWLRVYSKFSIPSSVPILCRSLVGSTSIITHKMFLESHLLRSTSGTRTFTMSSTFRCGNFSLTSLVILNACVSKLLFTVFLFSIILFLRLIHID